MTAPKSADRALSLRYDSSDDRFGRRKAINAFFHAIQAHYPEVLVELRDLAPHRIEGYQPIEAQDVSAHSQALKPIGNLHQISSILSQNPEAIIPQATAEEASGAPVAPIRQLVVIDNGLGTFVAPVIVVFVPRAVSDWAEKWRIAAPSVEIAASLLRHRWKNNPESAQDCSLISVGEPVSLTAPNVTTPSEAQWTALGVASIGAQPMVESKEQFVMRARNHYDQRVSGYYRTASMDSKLAYKTARIMRELTRDASWLARVQVGQERPSVVAQKDNATRAVVDSAVRELADFIGLPLRLNVKKGRPTGAVDRHPRRRVPQK